MKVAIIGAGLSGLTAAFELNKLGIEVNIFEKEAIPGGAASGFKKSEWNWYLDNTYHHSFTNDSDILSLAHQVGFNDILVKRPITANLMKKINDKQETKNKKQEQNDLFNVYCSLFTEFFGTDNEIIKLDSPLDLLWFDRLSLFDRLRTGVVLALLKFGPNFPLYNTVSAKNFLINTMGLDSYKALWQTLLDKKFEKYSESVNAAFFWARINKRTPSLCYPEGGFQAFCNHFANLLIKSGVKIKYSCDVKAINQERNGLFTVHCLLFTKPFTDTFNVVINTLPSPQFLEIEHNVLPRYYREQLSNIDYVGAQTAIFETDEKVLTNAYWLSILDPENPWMVAVQHTNFMDKSHYNNKEIFYLGRYSNTPTTKFLDKPGLIKSYFLKYAQPIYSTDFLKYKPDYITPVKNLYFANLELTYPYDRGTNYAVKVGRDVVKHIVLK